MNRRLFVKLMTASAVMLRGNAPAMLADISPASDDNLRARWKKLDDVIRGWWSEDLHRADESAVRNDPRKTLLFLPFPYSSAGGSEAAFPELYGWDTDFINLALLAHNRAEIVRWQILDQLSMIDRFGKVLNGNRTYYMTRSQPPLLAWSLENYLAAERDSAKKDKDDALALRAYPSLEHEYSDYWNGRSHVTPIGLSTCRDSGDPSLSPQKAAEAESGLDFTPIFGGDVRRCVPIHINCALVRYAQLLGSLADRFGWHDKATRWRSEAAMRAERINQYCWDEGEEFYFEYDYVSKRRLPYYSLNAYWPLWAGVASQPQAQRLVNQLKRFDQPFGLAFTDKNYPNPYPEYKALQWAYPEAWPPEQIIVAQGLERYGLVDSARAVSRRYIRNVVETWEKTEKTWERYNAVTGGHEVPLERQAPRPLHGFSSAAAVVVGRMAFD